MQSGTPVTPIVYGTQMLSPPGVVFPGIIFWIKPAGARYALCGPPVAQVVVVREQQRAALPRLRRAEGALRRLPDRHHVAGRFRARAILGPGIHKLALPNRFQLAPMQSGTPVAPIADGTQFWGWPGGSFFLEKFCGANHSLKLAPARCAPTSRATCRLLACSLRARSMPRRCPAAFSRRPAEPRG